MKKDVKEFFMKYHEKCWDRIKKEIKKHSNENNAVNRIICIIREENRRCNEDSIIEEMPLKEDALLIAIKKLLLLADIENALKSAAKYL